MALSIADLDRSNYRSRTRVREIYEQSTLECEDSSKAHLYRTVKVRNLISDYTFRSALGDKPTDTHH